MACFRLVTFFPLRPLFSAPRFILCISFFTCLPAVELYFFLEDFLTRFFAADFFEVFFVAIDSSPALKFDRQLRMSFHFLYGLSANDLGATAW